MEQYDIVIVGGGMAGLSAALYGGWLGRKVFLAERQVFGGQIVNADQIENYPGFPDGVLGADLVSNVRMQAMKFGAKMAYAEIACLKQEGSGFCLNSSEQAYAAGAVIIATGGRQRALGVGGEAEFEGRGVSRCATCDGAFFAEKSVAVVGGGDTAFDEALYLANVAAKVTIVHKNSQPTASATLMARARENPKIELAGNATVEEIIGGDSVEGVRLSNGSQLPVDGVFIAVGFEPETSLLQNFVRLDGGGHASVDLQMQTGVPGLFAVGAARQGNAGQLASVAGDGVTAAMAAH
ncbi:MAG: NAD(P)/FAD-dependent oxidoreductase, partial [Alphaproteobacteria bacterium]